MATASFFKGNVVKTYLDIKLTQSSMDWPHLLYFEGEEVHMGCGPLTVYEILLQLPSKYIDNVRKYIFSLFVLFCFSSMCIKGSNGRQLPQGHSNATRGDSDRL